MKTLSFDLAYMDSTQDFLTYLQEVCEVFQLQIIGLIPVGPAGGWPEVTFKGEEDNLRRFTHLFFEGCEPDYFDDNSNDVDEDNLLVFSDPRFTTKGRREFINDDGTFVE